jgi:hypothetical protein
MEEFRNVVRALRTECDDRWLAYAFTAKVALGDKCPNASELVSVEPSLRRRVDRYMRHWSVDLLPRKAPPVVVLLVSRRMLEAAHFGEWLVESAPPFATAKKEAQFWFSWLTVDCWHAAGLNQWRMIVSR